jgi:DNA-directed RNA polymerase specialized sigma24 family protein
MVIIQVSGLAFSLHGKTYTQIAKTFNKSENTIKSWVKRALPKLKTCLEAL